MYSQAPLKHRKLLITFVIIGPRVDRGASINQGVSTPQPVFFLLSKTIKMAGDQGEVEGKRRRSEGEARLVPEINCSYNSSTYRNFSFSKILYPNLEQGRNRGWCGGGRGRIARTDRADNSAIVHRRFIPLRLSRTPSPLSSLPPLISLVSIFLAASL